MKILQIVFIIILFLSPYTANAARETDSYDGNIFPIYAGNGAIVPPQTTLQESLRNNRTSVLFFYLDDSSDSKSMAPIISGLDLIWRNNIDIIALTTDELQNEKETANTDKPRFYWNGLIPQTIVLDGTGEIKFDSNGIVNIDDLNKVIGEIEGIEINNSSFSLETFNEYNSVISEKTNLKKDIPQ